MLPKASAIEAAIRGGVRRVHVISYNARDSVLAEVFTNEGTGTMIVADIQALSPAEQHPERPAHERLGQGGRLACVPTAVGIYSVVQDLGPRRLQPGNLQRAAEITKEIRSRKIMSNKVFPIIGVVLIAAGAIALARGGFSFTKDTHEAKIGSLELSVEEKETFSIATVGRRRRDRHRHRHAVCRPAQVTSATAARMLQMRPNCECCDRDLPPGAADAMICSFECTWCAACAQSILGGKCPNCGGNLVPRPTRCGEALVRNPASTARVLKPGCGQA